MGGPPNNRGFLFPPQTSFVVPPSSSEQDVDKKSARSSACQHLSDDPRIERLCVLKSCGCKVSVFLLL